MGKELIFGLMETSIRENGWTSSSTGKGQMCLPMETHIQESTIEAGQMGGENTHGTMGPLM